MEKKKLISFAKYFLSGTEHQFLDKSLFYLSGKRVNGSVIGNKIKNRSIGKRKYKSDLPLIIIGGCPRSGTTLIQMLLKTIPKIDGPYNEICFPQDTEHDKKLQREFKISHTMLSKFREVSKNDPIFLSNLILQHYKTTNNLDHILLKAPKYILFLDEIFKYFPKTKFIHITRDGRDVAISMQKYYKKLTHKTYPLSYCARLWTVCINRGRKFIENDNYIEIKYEDLIKDPVEIIKILANFLSMGLPDEKKIKTFYKQIDAKKVPTHKNQISKGIYSNKIGRYKKELNEDQIKLIEKIEKNALEYCRY